MTNDVPIIQKVYDFYRAFHKITPHIPKYDRYTIGEKIANKTLDLFEDLIYASRTDRKNKLKYLEEAAAKLDLIKVLLRLSEDEKALPTIKYLILSEKLQEIGKMLGGWIRSLI